jgi:hypothetical protein
MKKFTLWNNILGWAIFVAATIVYFLTLEPTTSLWDCGEFIATSYKLEVSHPPGAPVFMLMARFFTLFAGDPLHAAKMVNAMSAILSGLTVMFLFWTITHLAKKILAKGGEISTSGLIAILGSGLVGALAYAFSDSFWFSAVEGEVYATSSFFTAIVFWAILKWENVADEKHANRWIILIAYLMGLSIGVHLLNLLAIPAIVLVYYFKKYEVTPRGIFYALMVSVVILAAVLFGVIKGFFQLALYFELAFVNGFGLPYFSGVLFYLLLIFGLITYGIYYTVRKEKVVLNTILVSFAVIIIGYSCYALILIRSAANPPMDMNNPETISELLSYLNREQYGTSPIFKGPYYNAPIIDTKETKPTYRKIDGKYKIIERKLEYVYDKRFLTFFPRMYSNDPSHVQAYQSWVKIKGKSIRVETRDGKTETLEKPSFGNNLAFFFKYQIGHMYLRYFMWNFAGRQNDIQGYGGVLNGNWISGINFIDEARLGPQDKLPAYYKNHAARNKYYMLPLLLGLVGLFYHSSRHKKDFSVVVILFLMTGIAIVIYLNQKPLEPRERDYSYVGSFYAFAIWIGLGLLSLYDFLRKKIPGMVSAVVVLLACLILVPGIMAKENWDDHNRSGRYTARDLAYNYLNSCAPNAIIFTNGDNDTFPLWYAQEVEGIRTDVRIINLMLFNTEWYIDQMKRKAYDSDPIPLSLPNDKYKDGTNNAIYLIERIKIPVEIKQVIDFIKDDDPRTKFTPQPNLTLDYIPTKNFRLSVDSSKVIKNGTVKPKDAHLILPHIDFRVGGSSMLKNEMMQLDILGTNEWERPIYFVSGGAEGALKLEDYFQNEGYAYRFVPIRTSGRNFLTYGRIDTDILYDNLMNKFKYGRMEEPDVYLDFYNIRTIAVTKLRNNFTRLAEELLKENKKDSAIQVLDRIMELAPNNKVPYDLFVPPIAAGYYSCGEKDKANKIVREHLDIISEELVYYFSLDAELRQNLDYELRVALQLSQEYVQITGEAGDTEMNQQAEELFTLYYQRYLQSNPQPQR